MKIPRLVTIATATLVVVILYFIFQQNNIASSGVKKYSYTTFNWSKPEVSKTVMDFWKAHESRVTAIKKIVDLDYLFMIVYCTYLCFSLNYLRKIQQRHWLKIWLGIGIGAVILCTILDAIQNYKIYKYLISRDAIMEMRYYTWIKWGSLFIGIIPLMLSLIPDNTFRNGFGNRALRWLSQLLKSLWVFFQAYCSCYLRYFVFGRLARVKTLLLLLQKTNQRQFFR